MFVTSFAVYRRCHMVTSSRFAAFHSHSSVTSSKIFGGTRGLSSNGTENLHKKSPRKPDLRHSDRLHASIGGLEWRSARSGTLIALSINLPSAWFAGHRFLNGFMRRKHPKTAVIVPTMRASNKPGFVGKPQPASLCRFSVPLLLRPPPCLLQHFAQVLCPVHD